MKRNLGKPLVSVVILTYNGEGIIRGTLDSVLAQNYGNFEIIVVDNASTDGTLESVKSSALGYPNPKAELWENIQVVENEKNIGFAGHNVGIETSRGEFVLLMNQDVILEKEFITKAVELIQQDEKIGAIQPKMKNRNDKTKIDSTGIKIFKSRRMVDRGQGEKDRGQYEKTEEVFGANGAVAFFRRKCLDDVNLDSRFRGNDRKGNGNDKRIGEYYDPDFFLYKEDVDLSWRIRLYGWKIIYCPKTIVYTERTSKPINEKGGAERMIKTRREQKQYVRYYSFKNHRLAMTKNELPSLFFRHLPWILPREIGYWLYILFFEPKTWPAVIELFKQMPGAWRKRKIIMENKKVGAREMGRWFK